MVKASGREGMACGGLEAIWKAYILSGVAFCVKIQAKKSEDNMSSFIGWVIIGAGLLLTFVCAYKYFKHQDDIFNRDK